MRPPKRPDAPSVQAGTSLEEILAAIRSRASFGAEIELEALESGSFTVVITRFKKPVGEILAGWQADHPGFTFAELPKPDGLRHFVATQGDETTAFYANGCQAYSTSSVGSVHGLLAHPHDFLPSQIRSGPGCAALALRVHLAGGSDQWVSRAKLDKFLASGRDGALTGMDWGQLPE